MSIEMIVCLVFIFLHMQKGNALLCYNGTFTYKTTGDDPLTYRGPFLTASDRKNMARTRCALTILCPDNAMCFLRSWRARSRHAWIVQRGCYRGVKDDPVVKIVNIPTRSMTCSHRRLRNAEYKVCLCKADWCNIASAINLRTRLLSGLVILWASILNT